MLARVLGEPGGPMGQLIALVRVFSEESYRRIRPLARRTPTGHRYVKVGAALPDRIVEVQHGKQEIGAIPLLPRPLTRACRQPGVQGRA